MEESLTIVLDDREVLSGVCGANDGNLRVLEGSLGGRINTRGNEIRFEGAGAGGVKRFKTMIDSLIAAVEEGESPSPEYVKALAGIRGAGENGDAPDGKNAMLEAIINIPHGLSRVFPRSRNQAEYILGMRAKELCFCIGPAGTGKTYLAVAEALSLILSRKARRLVLTRPVVEAGESLGFLPGDLSQKISPYLRPLYDAMEALIPFELLRRLEEDRLIEIAPLAYMRGRSLNNCVIILDEAQNTTKEQMKMFLTRIGEGARAVVTGDATQIDLPRRSESGLLHALSLLSGLEEIYFAGLNTGDVIRNPLIKKIIQAYDDSEK